ncbi:MAG: GAF domain-containing protein [Bacteroidota bacterium]
MAKKIRIQDVLQPGDILAILIIICGILIAIFLEGLAIKLIGISSAVLGALALIIMISQRLSEIVESNKFNIPETQNIKMTVIKDASAKRQTVENFNPSIDIDKISSEPTMGADEGFRIVSKTTRSVSKSEIPQPKNDFVHPAKSEEKIEDLQIEHPEQPIEKSDGVDVLVDNNSIHSEPIKDREESHIPSSVAVSQNAEPEIVLQDHSAELSEDFNNAQLEEKIDVIEESQQVEEIKLVETQSEQMAINQESSQSPENNETKEFAQSHEIISSDVEQLDNISVIPEPVISHQNQVVNEEPELPLERTITETVEEPTITDFKKKQIELPQNLFDNDLIEIDEPRKEFDALLSRILYVIPLVIKSRTTAFTFINFEKNYLILESYVTNVPSKIIDDTKIPMANDIISQIAFNAKPEILTEINPSAELDLIPYYSEPSGTSSFVGIPVFYENQVIGILTCDTNENDAYDAATITFLGQFSKLISGLVKSYTEKYDLIRSDKTLRAVQKFAEISSQTDATEETISRALFEAITNLYENYSFGICLYDEKRDGYYIYDYFTKYEFPVRFRNEPVDLFKTLLGQSILKYQTIVETPVQSKMSRVFVNEYPFETSFFISIPIKSESGVYGAIFFDGPMNEMDNYDIELLELLAREAAHSIDRFKLIQLFHKSAIIDPHTGLMNNYAFFRRLEEEVSRVHDFKSTVSFCLIAIDKYAAYSNEEENGKFEHIFRHIVSILNNSVHEYDVIGRLDTNIIGAILIGQSVDKAKFWAENIRNKAAISVLEIDGRRFTVTLSIGIAQISPADDIDSLLDNCNRVLNIAASKTNCVQVYH